MAGGQLYGGQALVEGVLIRGQRHAAIACRKANGEVVTKTETLSGWMTGQNTALPLIRGVLLLAETMQLGVRSLFFSARVADGHDYTAPVQRSSVATAIGISLLCAAGIFFVLPMLLTTWLEPRAGHALTVLVEGMVRLLVLVGYVRAIALVPGVRRLFEYHGAEHMTVNAHEQGVPLTVGEVRRFSVIHTRCGTAFMFTVMVLSMLAFGLLGPQSFVDGLVARVVLIPLIAALAYEVLRLSAAHHGNPLIALLSRPNLWLQSYTTRPPDDSQIALAIAAMQLVLALDAAPEPESRHTLTPAYQRVRVE